MDGLRQKLEGQGLRDIVYMVINHQGAQAQRLHPLLAEKLSANITLYKQPEDQPDVWQTLNGEKDDFFIYDRCGRLTHHISLPYSIIGHGHVEKAIRDTYCTRICGECTHESSERLEECRERPVETPPDADPAPAVDPAPGHEHHRGHHHGHHGHHHGHHHGYGHHERHQFHPRGFGRHDGHEAHHGQGVGQQGQLSVDVDQMVQTAVEPEVVMVQTAVEPEVVMVQKAVEPEVVMKV